MKVAKTAIKTRAASAMKPAKKAATARAKPVILSAPKGVRTLTHREVVQMVERAFAKRYGTNA